ncbi:MAG: ATP-dependent DNA helicase [Woeseia sp.]|nr:ATP-dependent DNA helicase [Woeseia sp.]
MAEAVADAIAKRERLVIEAGTGTGKTFAYLLPALQSGVKTIISTGTRALQDQLYHRDLPLIGKAVGRPVTTALLKGRANYLCLHRLDQAAPDAAAVRADLDEVTHWRHGTASGDKAELVSVQEDSSVWPLVTSTAENCLGQQCPNYQECFVVKARRAAQEADLVVVNHHLLLADLAMKESGFVEFLPGAEAVILDEAHQIPDLAAQFFGLSLGSRELLRLLDEVEAATLSYRETKLVSLIDGTRTAIKALQVAAPRKEGRYELSTVSAEIMQPLENLRAALTDLYPPLLSLSESSLDIETACEQVFGARERLTNFLSEDSWDGLRWLQVNPRSLRLHLTPLDVSGTMRGLLGAGHQAWILTSATLAVGEDFSHFTARLGLDTAASLSFPSPYALDRHGLVFTPTGLPAPSEFGYTESIMERIVPLLKMTRGGAFVLFTSHRALQTAHRWCKSNRRFLNGRDLLVQGSTPRDDLLRRFRAHGDAVLLGTGTFWEGVDVRGPALTIVAIDKLPFASPADPMTMARTEFIRRQGGNPFAEHQLPQAALALKQGAGRLLRDEADYGVIVLCDPRIRGKSYGKVFLQCMQPMPVTDDLDAVQEFFRVHEVAEQGEGA